MGKHEDKLFMKRFSAVIAALVVITIVIIFLASTHEREPDPRTNPSRLALAAERVAPVGAVRTELPAGEVSAQAPAPQPVEVASAPDGAAVYMSACQACHVTGAAGAPIPGSDLWAERAAKGAEILYTHAIKGFNAMPAKGGRMDLSDDEVRAAVDHMLAQ
jgi:cytochrome c5